MIAKLFEFFGVIGMLSVAAWLTAACIVLWYALAPERKTAYRVAAAIALFGFLLSLLNSHFVSQIRQDDSAQREAEVQQAQERLAAARGRLRDRAASINFIEDDADDALDLAGASDEPLSVYEQAVVEAQEPEWKREGKVERKEGMKRDDIDADDVEVADDEQAEDPNLRKLPPRALTQANRADAANLFLARWTLIACLIALAVDYLLRFNQTFSDVFPLPLAGHTLDRLLPRSRTVYVETTRDDTVTQYLDQVVRKGETFVYLGPIAPAPPEGFRRLKVADKPLSPRVPVITIAGSPDEEPYSPKDLFEMAWFGRASAIVVGEPLSRSVVNDMMRALHMRWMPRARARRTVNVVWHFDNALSLEELKALAIVASEVNFKLIYVQPDEPADEVAEFFDEYFVV